MRISDSNAWLKWMQESPQLADRLAPVDSRNPESPQKQEKVSTEPIIAYRCWKYYGWNLGAVAAAVLPFNPRKRMEAECTDGNRAHAQIAPHVSCDCGIYGFETLKSLVDNYGFVTNRVYGRVALWGRVERHAKGYRAQYAYPQVIYRTPGIDADAIAAAWGIEVVPLPPELKTLCDDLADRQQYEQFVKSWRRAIEIHRNTRGVPLLDSAECYERHKRAEEAFSEASAMRPAGYGFASVDPRDYQPTRR